MELLLKLNFKLKRLYIFLYEHFAIMSSLKKNFNEANEKLKYSKCVGMHSREDLQC